MVLGLLGVLINNIHQAARPGAGRSPLFTIGFIDAAEQLNQGGTVPRAASSR